MVSLGNDVLVSTCNGRSTLHRVTGSTGTVSTVAEFPSYSGVSRAAIAKNNVAGGGKRTLDNALRRTNRRIHREFRV